MNKTMAVSLKLIKFSNVKTLLDCYWKSVYLFWSKIFKYNLQIKFDEFSLWKKIENDDDDDDDDDDVEYGDYDDEESDDEWWWCFNKKV